jgi:hypothetical protein
MITVFLLKHYGQRKSWVYFFKWKKMLFTIAVRLKDTILT